MNSNEFKKLINFLEELSWIFNSNKNLDISFLLNEIKRSEKIRNSLMHNSNYSTEISDKTKLVGILPSLLNDKKLFSKNSDLVDFAESAFRIEITRPEKRSRYEIIGLIVMELFQLKNNEIFDITDSIQRLSNNSNLKAKLRSRKNKTDFSWNIAIREITNQ